MKNICNKVAKLIDVKSIMTLLFSGVFCFLSVTGKINPSMFVTIFSTIIGFYYGRKQGKDEERNDE